MKPRFALGIVLAFCLLWLGLRVAWARDKVQTRFHQTFPLATNGEVRLDNVNGRIHITTWERSEVEVDAVKRGNRASDLDAVKIDIDAKPEQIRIHTQYPRFKWSFWGRNNTTFVDYEIKVPAPARLEDVQNVNGSIDIEGVGGKVHAKTVNGRLVAEALSGDATLSSVNGRVVAAFEHLDGVSRVSVDTVNGRVRLTLPEGANAEISAHTVNGSIHTGPELNPQRHWPVGTDLHGKLGQGSTRVKAETVNGSIDIRTAEAGQTPRQHTAQPAPKAEAE